MPSEDTSKFLGFRIESHTPMPCSQDSNVSMCVVCLQDGTLEKDIPSTDLFPVHHLDELEFFPGDFVVPADGKSGRLEQS